MTAPSYPTLMPMPFASVSGGPHFGGINTIPSASAQPLASLADGFPDVNMKPISSGGVPPDGRDFNGILNWITQHITWLNVGGGYKFSSILAAAIGGYSSGSVLLLNDGITEVKSIIASNTNDPNSNMSGWMLVDEINVLQFLADPTGATDSSAAFQAAINYANGRWIHAPSGIYKIGTELISHNVSGLFDPGLHIYGDGARAIGAQAGTGGTIILNCVPSGYLFDINHSIGSTSYANQVYSQGSAIEDLAIIGNASYSASGGIHLQGVWSMRMTNVWITDHTGDGIFIDTTGSNADFTATCDLLLQGCNISHNNNGIYAPTPQACPGAHLINTNVDYNAQVGITHCSSKFKVIGGSISFNGTNYTGTFAPNDAYGGYLIPNTAAGTAMGCVLDGVEIDGNMPQSAILGSCQSPLITRCHFRFRVVGSETQKTLVVFGYTTPAGSYLCQDPTFEHNQIADDGGNFTSFTSTLAVKFRQGCIGGHVGPNTYNMSGSGHTLSNLFFISEDIRTAYAGGLYGLSFEDQESGVTAWDNSLSAYATQYRAQVINFSVADQSAISFQPPEAVGTIIVSNGYGIISGMFTYGGSGAQTIASGTHLLPYATALTGTTGTSGLTGISFYPTTGLIYYENRTGGPVVVSISVTPDPRNRM